MVRKFIEISTLKQSKRLSQYFFSAFFVPQTIATLVGFFNGVFFYPCSVRMYCDSKVKSPRLLVGSRDVTKTLIGGGEY